MLLRAHCLRAAARAALTSIEELVIAEMRLASDLMRWVWRGQRCCVVSSWIVNLLACKCTASERDAPGALRSSLARAALGKSTKARPRASHIIQYSTCITYSIQLTRPTTTPHQPPPITSPPAAHTRCRAIYLCICICIYCLFIFTAVVSSLAAPILDNVTLKAGPRPGPCRSRPIGLSRSCRWRKNTVFIICLA